MKVTQKTILTLILFFLASFTWSAENTPTPAIITNPATAEESLSSATDAIPVSATAEVTPKSATPEVSSATPEEATKSVIIDTMEKSAAVLSDSVSKAIDVSRTGIKQMLGGEQSSYAKYVDSVLELLTYPFLGWPLWQYVLSFLIIFITYIIRHFLTDLFLKMLIAITARTKTTVDDYLVDILKSLIPSIRIAITLLGMAIAIQLFFINSPFQDELFQATINHIQTGFKNLFFLLFLINIGWAFCLMTDAAVETFAKAAAGNARLLDTTFVPIIQRTIKVFIIVVVVMQALYFFKYQTLVNSLMAAAGVSGLAIGLAAQDTIKNFFGSIVLLVDRPFSIGDWIIAGNTEGVVESVGFRSTKIRTFAKTLITIPNSQIVDRDINNFSRMYVRRVKMTIGVTYTTTPEQMEELLENIRNLLKKDRDVWPNLVLVRFINFAPSALEIFIYYFSKTTRWDEHLAVRERINLELMRLLKKSRLEFAFPTQTLHLKPEEPPESVLLDLHAARQEFQKVQARQHKDP